MSRDGQMAIVAENLRGPVTDLLWHDGRLYISHGATVSALAGGKVTDIITAGCARLQALARGARGA